MSKPSPSVAAALPPAPRPKLGRPPKNKTAGARLYKVASLFDRAEWAMVEAAAHDARTTPAGVIRFALRHYGVDVAKPEVFREDIK